VGIAFFLAAIFFGIPSIIKNIKESKTKQTNRETIPKAKELQELKLTNEAIFENFEKEIKNLKELMNKISSKKQISKENTKNLKLYLKNLEKSLNEIITRIEENSVQDFCKSMSHPLVNFYTPFNGVIFMLEWVVVKQSGKLHSIELGKTYLMLLNLIKHFNIDCKITYTDEQQENKEYPYKQDILSIINSCLNFITIKFSDEYEKAIEYKKEKLKIFKEKLIAAAKNLYSQKDLYHNDKLLLMSLDEKEKELKELLNSIEEKLPKEKL
jgi:hypothetical protein